MINKDKLREKIEQLRREILSPGQVHYVDEYYILGEREARAQLTILEVLLEILD